MHKRGRCRQYIVISGQETVSDAGWHTCRDGHDFDFKIKIMILKSKS